MADVMDEFKSRGTALIGALRLDGRAVAEFETGTEAFGVNVWAVGLGRYPAESVYVDSDGFTWGGNFEFQEPLSADSVAKKIVESIRGGA
jgi:hypothetical protein